MYNQYAVRDIWGQRKCVMYVCMYVCRYVCNECKTKMWSGVFGGSVSVCLYMHVCVCICLRMCVYLCINVQLGTTGGSFSFHACMYS